VGSLPVVSLEFGVAYFPTDAGIGPGPLARLVEEHGYVALGFADHTHIPASRDSPYPSGGPLPRKYSHLYDVFVALTAAAATTSRLRIGSCVCLVTERDPIVTANQVASIDHLSGGRFEFGVGAGWNREEMRNHGTDPRTRMRVMRERVEAMKAIWTCDEASYAGEFVQLERIWSWPKPVQRPHPPVLVGGNGATVLDRVLAFGDAWIPNYAREGLVERITELRSRADRPIPVDVTGRFTDAETLASIETAGVRRAMQWLPTAGRSVVERELERWDRTIAEFTGEV
jgi:probable F420-dependent oxidoreductase